MRLAARLALPIPGIAALRTRADGGSASRVRFSRAIASTGGPKNIVLECASGAKAGEHGNTRDEFHDRQYARRLLRVGQDVIGRAGMAVVRTRKFSFYTEERFTIYHVISS